MTEIKRTMTKRTAKHKFSFYLEMHINGDINHFFNYN